MEMNINNILVKMLLRENRKVVLTENSLDKAIDKARKQVLSPIYIDLFSQIEDKEELLRDINSPYIPHLTAQKYIETIDSTTVGEAETHINEWVYSVVKAIDITFGVDMTLVKKDPARQPLILAMNNMLIRTLAERKIDLYVPEANKIAMFMNNLKVDKIDENMMNDISSMDMGQFMDKYASDIMANQKETEAKHQNIQYSGNGYTCVKISSFEEASKYAPYCKWCISHTKAQWDKHTNYNGGLFYFFLKDGYQNIPEQHGKDTIKGDIYKVIDSSSLTSARLVSNIDLCETKAGTQLFCLMESYGKKYWKPSTKEAYEQQKNWLGSPEESFSRLTPTLDPYEGTIANISVYDEVRQYPSTSSEYWKNISKFVEQEFDIYGPTPDIE
jgi:hypothetical protein